LYREASCASDSSSIYDFVPQRAQRLSLYGMKIFVEAKLDPPKFAERDQECREKT